MYSSAHAIGGSHSIFSLKIKKMEKKGGKRAGLLLLGHLWVKGIFVSIPTLSLGDCVMNRVFSSIRALRVATFATLLTCVVSQVSYVQLIAYEGLDYEFATAQD